MPFLDGPKHTEQRKLMAKIFQMEVRAIREKLDEIAEQARQDFGDVSGNSEDFYVNLPTQFTLMVDYHLVKSSYANFSGYFALYGLNRRVGTTANYHTYVLTPRYEKLKFGVQLPLSYNGIAGFNAGVGLRWGPVYLGSSNLLKAAVFDADFNRANVYLGVRISKLGF